MRSTGDEMNISATLNEPRAEIPANAARPHDRNSQRTLLKRSRRSILCPPLPSIYGGHTG